MAVHRPLHPDRDPGPNVIDMAHVVEIDSAVRVDGDDFCTQGFERWVDEQFIRRIPGADPEAQ